MLRGCTGLTQSKTRTFPIQPLVGIYIYLPLLDCHETYSRLYIVCVR